jgi:thioredoxin 1
MEHEMGSAGSQPQDGRDAPAVKPRLVFFYSPTSGRSRRVEAYLAHATQRRKNHATFELVRVNVDERPDLAERFGVEVVPTLIVVEGRRVVRRITSPRSTVQLENELAAWLR